MKTELPKRSEHLKNKLGLIKSKILAIAEGKIDKIILFGSLQEAIGLKIGIWKGILPIAMKVI